MVVTTDMFICKKIFTKDWGQLRADKEAADQQEINSQYWRQAQDKYRTQPITNNSLTLYSLLRGLHCDY